MLLLFRVEIMLRSTEWTTLSYATLCNTEQNFTHLKVEFRAIYFYWLNCNSDNDVYLEIKQEEASEETYEDRQALIEISPVIYYTSYVFAFTTINSSGLFLFLLAR